MNEVKYLILTVAKEGMQKYPIAYGKIYDYILGEIYIYIYRIIIGATEITVMKTLIYILTKLQLNKYFVLLRNANLISILDNIPHLTSSNVINMS